MIGLVMIANAVLILLPGIAELMVGLWSTELWGVHLCARRERQGFIEPSELPLCALLFVTRALVTAVATNDPIARSSDAAA